MPALEVNPLYAGHGSGQRIDQLAFGSRLERADDGDDSIGYRDVAGLATEPALESLRRMAGFQDLLRDASFPANPFNR